MATSTFLLLSPSNHQEVGGKKLLSFKLFFLQIRDRPDKAIAREGWGA